MSDCICRGFRGLCIDENDGVVGIKSKPFEYYFVYHNYSSVSYLSQAGSVTLILRNPICVLPFFNSQTCVTFGEKSFIHLCLCLQVLQTSIVSIFIVLEFVGGFPLPGLLKIFLEDCVKGCRCNT